MRSKLFRALVGAVLLLGLLVVAVPSNAAGEDEIHWTITGPTSVSVDWRGTDATIGYGTTTAYGQSATATNPSPAPFSSGGPFWEARLTGLSADTVYHYSIGGGPDHLFRTAPAPGSSSFTVEAEGDIGSSLSTSRVTAVQAMIAADQPQLVLGLGDLAYASSNLARVDQHFNDMMVWSGGPTAYEPAWGNHESDAPDDLRNYKGRFDFANPQTSPGSPSIACCGEDWHWFDYGNTRFITYPEPWTGAWSDWKTKATAVMDQAQADPNITFIVTYGHRPAYSSGHHPGSSTLASHIAALAATHNKYVLNLNGHSHNYERTFPQGGVVHITAGTGGASLEQDGPCLWLTCTQPSWSAKRYMHLGVLKLGFGQTSISGSFICGPPGGGTTDITCNQGDVIDSFQIQASGTPTDTTPPSVALTAPGDGATVSGTVPVAADATDDTGVDKVDFLLDGTVNRVDTTAPYGFDWDTTTLSNGAHTLQAVAYDNSGNTTSSSLVTVTTINTLLTETLTFAPTADAFIMQSNPTTNYGLSTKVEVDNSPVAQFLMTFTVSGVGTRSVTGAKLRLWNVNASNRGGDFHFSGAAWNESTVTWNTAPTYDAATIASLGAVALSTWVEVDLSSVITGDGTYSFRVTSPSSDGADYTSREGSSGSRPQLVITTAAATSTDTTPPSVSIADPTDGSTVSGTVPVTANATDDVGVGRVEFLVDETVQVVDSVPPFAFDWDTRAVSNGTHTLQAVAYDIAGNAGSSSIVTVTVSNSSTETLTFTPTSDATIKKKYPTTNYGVSTKVEVDNSPVTQYLITFTVSGVGTRSVTGAKLRLWNVNASNRGGDFHVGNVAWNERTVTWNTAPTYDAATIASLGAVARNTWVEVDLTSVITGDGTYSFRVTSPSSDGADYTSREGSSASRPQLVVTVA